MQQKKGTGYGKVVNNYPSIVVCKKANNNRDDTSCDTSIKVRYRTVYGTCRIMSM